MCIQRLPINLRTQELWMPNPLCIKLIIYVPSFHKTLTEFFVYLHKTLAKRQVRESAHCTMHIHVPPKVFMFTKFYEGTKRREDANNVIPKQRSIYGMLINKCKQNWPETRTWTTAPNDITLVTLLNIPRRRKRSLKILSEI